MSDTPTITVAALEKEMKRIHTDLKKDGETTVNYREVGGITVAKSLIKIAAHPLEHPVKRKFIKGTDEMRVYVDKPKDEPKPKAEKKAAKKSTAKKAEDDERVKVTSTSET